MRYALLAGSSWGRGDRFEIIDYQCVSLIFICGRSCVYVKVSMMLRRIWRSPALGCRLRAGARCSGEGGRWSGGAARVGCRGVDAAPGSHAPPRAPLVCAGAVLLQPLILYRFICIN